jgi:hypothetical protein
MRGNPKSEHIHQTHDECETEGIFGSQIMHGGFLVRTKILYKDCFLKISLLESKWPVLTGIL